MYEVILFLVSLCAIFAAGALVAGLVIHRALTKKVDNFLSND
jgi:hypothetical protein